jgi:hypothetical protein
MSINSVSAGCIADRGRARRRENGLWGRVSAVEVFIRRGFDIERPGDARAMIRVSGNTVRDRATSQNGTAPAQCLPRWIVRSGSAATGVLVICWWGS